MTDNELPKAAVKAAGRKLYEAQGKLTTDVVNLCLKTAHEIGLEEVLLSLEEVKIYLYKLMVADETKREITQRRGLIKNHNLSEHTGRETVTPLTRK